MSDARRYPVTLTRGGETLRGEQRYEYPFEIEAGGFRFYRMVWREAGWTVIEQAVAS